MEDGDITIPEKVTEVSGKKNLTDWLIYTIISIILYTPFLYGEWFKHVSVSILTGFLFGMLNRIIRELVFIKNR